MEGELTVFGWRMGGRGRVMVVGFAVGVWGVGLVKGGGGGGGGGEGREKIDRKGEADE